MARFASTSTPLGSSGTTTLSFTPSREDYIVGSVIADQAGTIFFEQSMDGINWDISTSYAVAANDGKGFSETVLTPFVRIRYVNGGVAQGTFRLYARFASAGDS